MLLSRGNPITFIERPLSAGLLAAAAGLLLLVILPQFRKTREEAFQEE
jgi:putative tricarboxylic transport membrane protein